MKGKLKLIIFIKFIKERIKLINHKTETYFQKLKLILSTNSAKAIQMDFAAIINRAKLCKKQIKTVTLNSKMVMSFLTINL